MDQKKNIEKPHLVVFSGAGMSAESGLKTFRDNDGLWENHKVTDVATPEAWQRDPELVLRFYNMRRKQLMTAKPNKAHKLVAALESNYRVSVITQNIDDLHERAGSSKVMHLHGELKKVQSERYPELVYEWEKESIALYPAAGIINYVPPNCDCFIIDPNISSDLVPNNWTILKTTAEDGMKILKNKLNS